MRETIDGVSGDKRGENVVKMVSHEDLESQIIGFYSGKKESEKTIVQQYCQSQHTLIGTYGLDTLNTCPTLLEELENKGEIYLAQIKKIKKSYLKNVKIWFRICLSSIIFKT